MPVDENGKYYHEDSLRAQFGSCPLGDDLLAWRLSRGQMRILKAAKQLSSNDDFEVEDLIRQVEEYMRS
jgi:hypothetical protein